VQSCEIYTFLLARWFFSQPSLVTA